MKPLKKLLLAIAFLPLCLQAQLISGGGGGGGLISGGGANGGVYVDVSGVPHATATGGAGTLCYISASGGIPTWGSCAGSASSVWSALSSPVANLALAMAANTTTITYGAATGAATNPWTITDTTNNTGTGALVNFATASGSALYPLQVTALGSANGIRMSTAGLLGAIGTGGINATQLGGVAAANYAQTNVTTLSSLTSVGTINTGVWQGTALTSTYLPATTVYTGQANTYSTGLQSFAAATIKIPTSASFVASASSMFGYDSTAGNSHIWFNGADAINAAITGSPANNDCAKFTVSAGAIGLTTAGAACGSGSGAVSSFSGDGSLLSNSASTGAVTATLATAGAHKYWGNPTGSTAAPGYSALVTGDLPTGIPNANLANVATTPNGQTCTLGSTCNVNSGAAAHSVSLNEGAGSAIAGAAIGTSGRLLIDQGASADPSFNAMSQDCALTNAGVITCTKSNNVALGAFATATGAINPESSTYQVVAADFTNLKTITVASGTFTITLVISTSQPAAGQYITVINYGSGVVTIARNGQNINGGTASLTLAAAGATTPTSAQIWSDGTNYLASLDPGSSGGSISGLTTSLVPKAASSTSLTNSSVTDNGTTLSTTEPFTAASVSTGTSPPSVTAGTGGVDAMNEGTAPSVCAALTVDCVYASSTQHGLLSSFNNGGYLPLTQGPASSTSGNVATWNSAAGGILADAGFLATNVVLKSAANTAGTAMTLDMSGATGATAFKVPVIASATAGADGVIDYDSTAKLTHVRTNGADSSVIAETSTSTTTTQVLHATATGGIGAFSALATGDLPTGIPNANLANVATTPNGQTCTLGSTCNVNSGAAAHSVSLNEGAGTAIAGAAIGTSGRLLIDQGAGADPSFNAMSQDCALTNAGVITCTKSNNVALGAFATATAAINVQTSTYQALAADFTNLKTITAASGTFTITLVASGSQPAAGQYINVVNYGSGVVTIARSGQNINGGTSSLTLPAASATAPTAAQIWSDGTNYFATLDPGSSGLVTSASFTGGLISVATPTTTPAFTVAGASGGVPYFNSSTTWSTSAALTANGVVLGGGAGAAPSVTAADSTTTHALFATAGAPAFRAMAAGDVPASLSSTTSVNGTTIPASVTLTQTIASGTSALGTGAISANTCATVVTTTATGTAATDAIAWSPNADISGVTGYGILSTDGIKVYPYPTTDHVNWRACNGSGLSITPGAVTLNWRVTR